MRIDCFSFYDFFHSFDNTDRNSYRLDFLKVFYKDFCKWIFASECKWFFDRFLWEIYDRGNICMYIFHIMKIMSKESVRTDIVWHIFYIKSILFINCILSHNKAEISVHLLCTIYQICTFYLTSLIE